MAADWDVIDNSLLDPNWYAAGDVHDTFRALRHEHPFRWIDDKVYGKAYWSVAKYHDIQDVLANPQWFSSRGGTPKIPRSPQRFTPEQRHKMGLDVRPPNLDPPMHTVYRRPINKHFSVPAIAKLTDQVDQHVNAIIAEVAERETFDFMEDVAAQLPMRVVLSLFGVPKEDWAYVQEITGRYALGADPKYMIDNDAAKTTLLGAEQLDDYTTAMAEDRRKNPRDDLATVIGQLTADGDPLSLHEMRGWFTTLIIGGLETTRNLTGTLMWQLLEHPDQLALVRGDEKWVPRTIEEGLRWGAPARNILRIVVDDMDYKGEYLRAGDWVISHFISGNRDEDIWENADAFDITREPQEHLALGHGIHKCLGRNLVRLELTRFLPAFLRAYPSLEMTGEPQWAADVASQGFKKMPVAHHGRVTD